MREFFCFKSYNNGKRSVSTLLGWVSPRWGMSISSLVLPRAMKARGTLAPSQHCCHDSCFRLCAVGSLPAFKEAVLFACICWYISLSYRHHRDNYLLIQLQTFFFWCIFCQSFSCLVMCLRVAIGDWNMICLIQSHLLFFLFRRLV